MGTSQNRRLEWVNSFEVGVDVIDRQHRELVRLINQFGEAISNNDPPACQASAMAFLTCLSNHFEMEERCLVKAGYPRAREHADEHKAMLERSLAMQAQFNRESAASSHDFCFDSLLQVLVSDLLESDIKYKSHFQELGTGQRLLLAH
ncbi:MAG: hemerythrin family protein [Alphaproteobacteria bacterium]|nr:hemerythrin family protein [Alphaproteobacteria bacterium]